MYVLTELFVVSGLDAMPFLYVCMFAVLGSASLCRCVVDSPRLLFGCLDDSIGLSRNLELRHLAFCAVPQYL
jgi:hypothetical protein